jgi:hypothetical protein
MIWWFLDFLMTFSKINFGFLFSLLLAAGACVSTAIAEETTLRGLAEFKDVSGSAIEAHGRLLPPCRPIDLSCVEVHIKNDSSEVVVVDGNAATATLNGTTLRVQEISAMTEATDCSLTKGKKTVAIATAMLTFGYFGPLVSEALGPKKDLGVGFGKEGLRHRSESLYLGRRVIMPGDETTGWLVFSTEDNVTPQQVQIPLYSDKARKSGQIVLPVAAVNP